MKKKLNMVPLIMLALLFLAGCNGEKRRVSRESNSLTAAYVVKMDAGETTTEQDKRFIRAMSKVAYELDRSIRGDKKAKKTRESAEKIAETGIDPDSNMDLDDGSGSSSPDPESNPESVLSEIESVTGDIKRAVDKKVATESEKD